MIKHTHYFEGILQLRNVTQEALDFAIKEISKKENAHIAMVEKVTNGQDIYMAPQTFLRTLGNKLQSRFGGQLVVSRKLHTRNHQTGREVYRVNTLFRMPNFKKGCFPMT